MKIPCVMLGLLICLTSAAQTRHATTAPTSPPKSVVFVLDAGGAMMTTFDDVRHMVRAKLEELTPEQTFNIVILDKAAGGVLMFRDNAVSATPDIKARVEKFLGQVSPRGTPDLVTGMKGVAKLKPDEVDLYIAPDRGVEKVEAQRLAEISFPAHAVFKIRTSGHQVSHYLMDLASWPGGEIVDLAGHPITKVIPSEDDEVGVRVPVGAGARKKP